MAYALSVKENGTVTTTELTTEWVAKEAYRNVTLGGKITAKCLTVKRGLFNDVVFNDYI